MKIKKIEIRNFKSIKHLIINPSSLCALTGPNSVGKTNILKAINLVLGEGWTSKAKVARELFNDPNSPIDIKIYFDETVNYATINDQSQGVDSIEMKMSLNPELDVKTTINNGDKFYWQDNFKKECHFIYIPATRRLSDEMRVNNWTLLGKLMKLIHQNYIKEYDDELELQEDFLEKMKDAKEFLEKDFNVSDEVITFKNFSESFIKNCKNNSYGLANIFEPKLNIYNLNWFYKTLQINIKEKFPDKIFNAEDVGSGMQNLILISIFQTYAELMGGKVIFGIEEPEIFLYPQAQRSLYSSFIELSDNSQIFYTTHNPNFIDACRADEIEILQKNEAKGTYILEKDNLVNYDFLKKEEFKIYTNFNRDRNEIFFSKKVILVEGDSDKILWSTLFSRKWNIDLDKKGVVVIECGGKNGVNYFSGVCRLMNIDYFAIWDKDNGKNGFNPSFNYLEVNVDKNIGLELEDNLENFLKSRFPEMEFNNQKKIANAYKWAIEVKVGQIPNKFLLVREFVDKEDEILDSQSDQPFVIKEESLNNDANEDKIPF